MTTPDPGNTGATRDIGAIRDGRKKRFPLWLLLLLLLLLLAIIAGILVAALSGGSGKKAATVVPVPTVASTSPASTVTPADPETPTPADTSAPADSLAPADTTATADTAVPASPVAAPPTAVASAPVSPAPIAPLHGGFVGGGAVRPVPAAGSFAAGDTEGTVLFAENSAALTDYARSVIEDAAKVIRTDRPPVIVVSGYTDQIAGQPSNLKLSGQRATAVLAALKADVGPGPTAYSTKDHGENDPIASNSTPGGRQQNRRATITTD